MSDAPRIIPLGGELPALEPGPPVRLRADGTPRRTAGSGTAGGRRGGAVRRRFALLNAFIDSALRELGRAELAAWLILYRHAKPDGIVTASVADLARRAG